MVHFAKILSGFILLTVFVNISILDTWLGSEYVCDISGLFCIIRNGDSHFESFKNISNVISVWFKYLINF